MGLLDCQLRERLCARGGEAIESGSPIRLRTVRARSSFTAAETVALAQAPDTIVLILGDLLPRIPTQYLAMGLHDEQLELRFPLEEMLNELAGGRAATRLSKIAAVCPQLFEHPIAPAEDIEVPLPLEKVVDQIGWLHTRQRHPHRAEQAAS